MTNSLSLPRSVQEPSLMRHPWFTLDAARWHIGGLLGLVLLSAAGCATPLRAGPPVPEAPRIAQLSISPSQVAYGCPVTLHFRFEAPQGEFVRAYAAWHVSRPTRGMGSRVLTLPIDASQFAGKTSGEVQVPIRLEQYGTTVWYDVQVEDAGGRKSNVLSTPVRMDGPVPWEPKPPRCG